MCADRIASEFKFSHVCAEGDVVPDIDLAVGMVLNVSLVMASGNNRSGCERLDRRRE